MEKLYVCVGENYTPFCQMGYCGDVKTLDGWIDCLFDTKKSWFDGDTPKEIIDYIYKYCGKRLKLFKEV